MKKTSLQSTIGILMIAGILVLVNLIANTRFFRLDLTDGQIFTLSKASKQVVANLDEPLTIKVFASDNLSPQLNDVKRFLNDLLSDYRAYGKGNFHYEFVDPGSDDKLEKQAQDYRIPPFQENVRNKDKLELKKVYLGLVMLYQDQQQTIPTIQSTTGMEYSITSMLKKITSQQDKTVGFLTGHGEPSPFQQNQSPQQQRVPGASEATMAQVGNVLQGNYKVTTVDLSTEEKVPDDVSTLLIVAPNQAIPDDQQLKIDQYIMHGGSVGWFLSPVQTDLQRGQAHDLRLGIDDMTRAYGFRINNDLIADANCSLINIQQRQGFFTIQNTIEYPFFPKITVFNPNDQTVNNLKMLNLFFPSSIDTSLAQQAGVKLIPILYSGDQSLMQTGRYDINATQKIAPASYDRAGIVLGAEVTGPFKSAFAGKDLPTKEDGDPVMAKTDFVAQAPDSTRMFVIGDGNFMQDTYLQNASNVYLMLNAVDWLVNDTDLIRLRTREVSIRPLKTIESNATKAAWKYFNWFGPPLLIIILGLIYWQIRKNRRFGEI